MQAPPQVRFNDGASYETFMGVWSRDIGEQFLQWLAPPAGWRWADVGCGNGAFTELLVERCAVAEVCGIDPSPEQLAFARQRLATAPARFVEGDAMALPWPDASFDAVVCSAVLHFADDAAHFERMVDELWRVLAPRGLFFARLASNIGLETVIGPGGRRVRLPDGSDRFVVDEAILVTLSARLGGRLADPLKTTVVQGMCAMTTWCLLKG